MDDESHKSLLSERRGCLLARPSLQPQEALRSAMTKVSPAGSLPMPKPTPRPATAPYVGSRRSARFMLTPVQGPARSGLSTVHSCRWRPAVEQQACVSLVRRPSVNFYVHYMRCRRLYMEIIKVDKLSPAPADAPSLGVCGHCRAQNAQKSGSNSFFFEKTA